MTRFFPASIAVVSALAVVFYAAETPTPKIDDLPKRNQVYVKVIWPTDPPNRDKDRPVVATWIAEQLKKRGQSKFTAATGWVPLGVKGEKSTRVWNAMLDDEACGCPVVGQITERADGHITVLLRGWDPGGSSVTISLTDEPGSRAIAAVKETKREEGLPYVAVLIGPPREQPAAANDEKK